MIGGAGWGVYSILIQSCTAPTAALLATIVVILLSRLFAVRERCPGYHISDFRYISAGTGSGVYWTAYYIVTNELDKASQTGFMVLRWQWPSSWGLCLCLNCRRGFLRCFRKRRETGQSVKPVKAGRSAHDKEVRHEDADKKCPDCESGKWTRQDWDIVFRTEPFFALESARSRRTNLIRSSTAGDLLRRRDLWMYTSISGIRGLTYKEDIHTGAAAAAKRRFYDGCLYGEYEAAGG